MSVWRKLFGPPDVAKLLREKRFEPLVAALRDPDPAVRSAAAAALGELGDPRAVPPLVAALEQDDGELARAVGTALGRLGPPAIAPAGGLLARSRDFSHERTAGMLAMEGLVAAHGAACAGALTSCLPGDSKLFTMADRLLGGMGTASLPAVAAALRGGSPRERAAAAAHLGRRDEAEAVELLLQALRDPELEVRAAAVSALENCKDARVAAALVPLLQDPAPGIPWKVARALERQADPAAVEPLIAALARADEVLLGPIASALGRLGDPRAVEPLLDALERVDELRMGEVVGALELLNDRRAVPALFRTLERHGRLEVLDALVHFGGDGVFEAAAATLRRAESALRGRGDFDAGGLDFVCGTLRALGRLRDPRGVPLLLAHLESPLSYHVGDRDDSQTFHPVREAARAALAACGEHALPALRDLLTDAKRRYVAVTVLAAIPEPEAREILLEKLGRTSGSDRAFGSYLADALHRSGAGADAIPAVEGYQARLRGYRDDLQARMPADGAPSRSFPYEDLRLAGLEVVELDELLRRLAAQPAPSPRPLEGDPERSATRGGRRFHV